MPDILRPDRNSDENLEAFLQTIGSEDLRSLLSRELETVLVVGRAGSARETQAQRASFLGAIQAVIDKRMESNP